MTLAAGLGEVGIDSDLDPELGQEVHDILGAAIDFGMALLPAIALHLGHGHAVDADRELRAWRTSSRRERFDDRDRRVSWMPLSIRGFGLSPIGSNRLKSRAKLWPQSPTL
jgi:hypothetical protein